MPNGTTPNKSGRRAISTIAVLGAVIGAAALYDRCGDRIRELEAETASYKGANEKLKTDVDAWKDLVFECVGLPREEVAPPGIEYSPQEISAMLGLQKDRLQTCTEDLGESQQRVDGLERALAACQEREPEVRTRVRTRIEYIPRECPEVTPAPVTPLPAAPAPVDYCRDLQQALVRTTYVADVRKVMERYLKSQGGPVSMFPDDGANLPAQRKDEWPAQSLYLRICQQNPFTGKAGEPFDELDRFHKAMIAWKGRKAMGLPEVLEEEIKGATVRVAPAVTYLQ